MRVFENYNLLQVVEASITPDTSPCTTDSKTTNLITNLDKKSCGPDFSPVTSLNTPDTTIKSCLRSDESLLHANNDRFVLGIDLNQVVFLESLFFVEGHVEHSW